MKLKVINRVSAACFLISSASLLSIPFLDINSGKTTLAIMLALLFWIGLVVGATLQIILWIKTRKLTKSANLKTSKVIAAICFALAVICTILTLRYYETNNYALPINLFVLLFSAETFFMIKRRERL